MPNPGETDWEVCTCALRGHGEVPHESCYPEEDVILKLGHLVPQIMPCSSASMKDMGTGSLEKLS